MMCASLACEAGEVSGKKRSLATYSTFNTLATGQVEAGEVMLSGWRR